MSSWRALRALQAKNDAEKAGKEKVADRPHPVTVRLGLISPTIAVVAAVFAGLSAWVSMRALQVNEQNLKVGQRAYLSIKNSRAVVGIVFPNMEKDPKKCGLGVVHTYEVHNLGRTPADVVRNSQDLKLPEGWVDDFAEHRKKTAGLGPDHGNGWLGYVSQDSFESVADAFSLDADASDCQALTEYAKFQKAGGGKGGKKLSKAGIHAIGLVSAMQLPATLTFKDVFGDHHSVTWFVHPELTLEGGFDDVFMKRFSDHVGRSIEHTIIRSRETVLEFAPAAEPPRTAPTPPRP